MTDPSVSSPPFSARCAAAQGQSDNLTHLSPPAFEVFTDFLDPRFIAVLSSQSQPQRMKGGILEQPTLRG